MSSTALIPPVDHVKSQSVESRSAVSNSWPVWLDRLACIGSGGRVVPVQPPPARAPRVSVVIPCYNYGRYLRECVGSVLAQAGVAVDVVIVDDASPDGSGDVAEEIAAGSTQVRVLRHNRNLGHIATFNDGLAEAHGDYVVLLSADDLLTPGSLERATTLLEANPSVGMAYGHSVSFSEVPPAQMQTRPHAWTIWTGRDWLAERYRCGRNSIRSPEVVLRTSVQREIGEYRYDLPHTGDLEMWIRAAAIADVGRVGGVDQAWYREHEANMHTMMFRAGDLDGMAIDMRERLHAFESAAVEIEGRVPAADRLLTSARRALAIEALTLALRAHYWGIADAWPVDDLTALAVDVYPDARQLPQWRILPLHRRLGNGWRRHNPLSVAHELSLRGRIAARDWRQARAGL